MDLQLDTVMIGVRDLARAKAFYADLGCAVDKDFPTFVSFRLAGGSSSLALYEWDAAAADAGVPSAGSGFRGVSLHAIVSSQQSVDDLMAKAEKAGGQVVKAAAAGQWGGYFGYFADPDGHLWKVATP